jgi:spore coat polysaccharide biosynthesis protein SpsF
MTGTDNKPSAVVIFIQARMSSARFPGKVIMPLVGAPMMIRQADRLGRCLEVGFIQVLTSMEREDDTLVQICDEMNLAVFRGELDDVLDRFYQAAKLIQPEHVVRVTGDCPLIDPAVVDQVVEHHLENNSDYTSNIDPPTWPDGLDVEVIRFTALEDAWMEADQPFDREHVTPYIRRNKDRFRCGNVIHSTGDLSSMRWTVDEPEDYELVRAIYEGLHHECPEFGTEDILKWLNENPDWADINSHHPRNAQCTERVDG